MADNNLFSEFPPISKADWLKQIAKDLKDKPLEDLVWQVDQDLPVTPFVHAEDFKAAPLPLWANTKGWEICETILVKDPVAANNQAMQALTGGAEGIEFVFDDTPDWPTLEQTVAGIHLDYIGLHFAGPGITRNPSTLFSHLMRLAKAGNIRTEALRGSIAYDPVQAGTIVVDWRYLADLHEFIRESFPQFKIITVDFSWHENPVVALSQTLKTANEYLIKLAERGMPPDQTANTLQFSVPVGKSYFVEIAKIRALKLLWVHVLEGWKAPLAFPAVAAYFRQKNYSDDLYTNLIRGTSMAMSAVLGGADRLTVLPYDAGREEQATYPAAFGRRIARNVQHLMKMESGLDLVADPAAGSYYIEQLTQQLSEKAWELFTRPE